MPQQPDQFQRKVHVRLPYADKYIESSEQAHAVNKEIKELFQRPLIQVSIQPSALPDKPSPLQFNNK